MILKINPCGMRIAETSNQIKSKLKFYHLFHQQLLEIESASMGISTTVLPTTSRNFSSM